jgi:glutathione S-transferase
MLTPQLAMSEPSLKLCYSPGACSIGIHILLEEIGKPYSAVEVNLGKKQHHSDDFVAINPKSKVPVLIREDGSVLTEFPAIAIWLARANPQSRLLPDDIFNEAKIIEIMDYVVSTLHMQGFTRIFRPGYFAPGIGSDHREVIEQGRRIAARGFEIIDRFLSGRRFLHDELSIADAALFYVERWARAQASLSLPSNCARHFSTMMSRPAVERVLKFEGIVARSS